MTNTFIKRPELIEESYQTEDLLDFSFIINDFKEKINNINKNSVVGLIGAYGSGKSTMLYQIYKDKINVEDKNKNEINNNKTSVSEHNQQTGQWYVFDAWQYPERRDLWEGFVLEIARQHQKKLFNYARNIIDEGHGHARKNVATVAVNTANTFLPGAGILKNLIPLFRTSPVRRVFEFQELLVDIINKKIKKDIFIIVEDIDRSGDMGIFFLETLKYFIKKYEKDLKHKVIVIVPMGEEIWQEESDKKIRDSYLKVLDFQFHFYPENINFSRFIRETIDVNYLSEIINRLISAEKISAHVPSSPTQEIIVSHLQYLFGYMIFERQQGTIRDIKNILRKSESNFLRLQEEHQKLIDIRILILFTAIEYFYQKKKSGPYTFLVKDNRHGIEYIFNDFWGKELFYNIISEIDPMDIRLNPPPYPHKIYISDKEYWLPDGNSSDEGINYSINSAYFDVTGVKISKHD